MYFLLHYCLYCFFKIETEIMGTITQWLFCNKFIEEEKMNEREINELRGNYKLRKTLFLGTIFVVLGFILFSYTNKIINYTQKHNTQTESNLESAGVEVEKNRTTN